MPLAAIDFHISSVLEALVREEAVVEVAKRMGPDPESALRSAMWRCSSAVSGKKVLPGQREVDPPPQQLAALWAIASPHAECFALDVLSRKLA